MASIVVTGLGILILALRVEADDMADHTPSPVDDPDGILRRTGLTEAQAAGRACVSSNCTTPMSALTHEEQRTVRITGVLRVIPVKRCTPCALELQGMTVITDSSQGTA
jgi:hypothetical protein